MSAEFNQLRQTAAEFRHSQGPVRAERIEARLGELIGGAAVVSFDLFDTLTSRSVDHPVDLFHYLEFHPEFAKLGLGPTIPGLRVKAENIARREGMRLTGSEEILLPDIYRVFCALTKLSPGLVEPLTAAEEEVDLSLSLPNEGGRALFLLAEKSGKPIVILSDTYHRPEFILRLLGHFGYSVAADRVYCSSFHKKSKGRGTLFDVALKDLGIEAGALLHIGDNRHSDSEIPSGLGIRTLWHPYRVHLDAPRPFHAEAGALHSAVRSLVARTRLTFDSNSFWERIGFAVLGPLLTGYALWLRGQFEEKKSARAYFLLRDGEIFERVYRAVVGDRSPCPVRLLHSSRRAMIFPLFGQNADLVVPQLLAGIGKRPVGDYLSRLGVDPAPFAADFRAVGYEPDTPVDARLDFSRMVSLLTRPAILQAVAAAAGAERKLLVRYLEQEKVFASEPVALVDLGWSGTIHKAIHHLAAAHSPKSTFHGCYLATYPSALANLPPDLGFASYIAHVGEPADLSRALEGCREFFEVLCSSSEGSLLSFREEGGRIVPVLKERDIAPRQVDILAKVHEGAVRFAAEFKSMAERYGWKAVPPRIAVEEAVRLLSNPTKEEAMKIGQLTHGENWGTLRTHPLAAFRKDAAGVEPLWEDYHAAYWKKGLLNLPLPQAATLRTFLWLLEE